MRLFLALKVPPLDFSGEKFKKLKSDLESRKAFPRWISTDHLHIPLVELGDHGRGSFLRLYETIKNISFDIMPFDLKAEGLWGHPHQQEADMIWIGVQNSKEVRSLHDYLSETLKIDHEMILRPHIPLVHLGRKKNLKDVLSPFKNYEFGSFNIHEIAFYEKLSGKVGIHKVASHILHGEDLSGLGLS